MKFLKNLIKKTKILQRTIGLSVEQLKLLVKSLESIWETTENKRKKSKLRKRKIGGGRPYKLELLMEKLVVLLLYYKTYMTQEFVGLLVGLDQSNVSRLLKKLLLLIEQAADPELNLYLQKAKEEYEKIPANQKVNDWDTFLKKYPDLKEVSTDATEQECYRSSDYQTQKKYYSGKKKRHVLKTQISVSSSGRIVDVSATVPGSIHDKKLIDEEKTVEKFPELTVHRMDSGYQGIKIKHPKAYIILPHKKTRGKKLSPLAKELNTAHSKRRVIVENIISRIKKFKIISSVYRGRIGDYRSVFRNIVALINFKLATSIAFTI